MHKVSATIIVKNEEGNLKKMLPELTWCDEIIVVDDFSNDNTMAICQSFGCKVFQRTLDGFGAQKQFAVAQASNNWILSIDADEVPSKELVREITSKLERIDESIGGFYIPRRHIFMGTIFNYGRERAQYHLRLFNKQNAWFTNDVVHEKVLTEKTIDYLKGVILHDSYKDIDNYFTKFNRYTSLAAQRMFDKGKKKSILDTALTTPFVFLKFYLIERNFMNGTAGFIWSLFSTWYRFTKYVKLYELWKNSELNKTE